MIQIKKEILDKLKKFDNELYIENYSNVKVVIFGSASIVLKFDPSNFRPTHDIDLTRMDNNNKLFKLESNIAKIAWKYDINSDVIIHSGYWFELNDNIVEEYISDEYYFNSLKIYLPQNEFIVALKIIASSSRGNDDLNDILIKEVIEKIDLNKLELLMEEVLLGCSPAYNEKFTRESYNEFIKEMKKIKTN